MHLHELLHQFKCIQKPVLIIKCSLCVVSAKSAFNLHGSHGGSAADCQQIVGLHHSRVQGSAFIPSAQ